MSAAGPPKTLSACVASTNPVKVNAAKASLSQCFPSKETTVVGQKVPSGVPAQPMSDAETRQGALNRAKGAIHTHPGHDLYFGIEGGIEEDSNKIMHCFAWIVVLRAGDKPIESASRTSTFALPEAIMKLIRGGMELGDADDEVFKRRNSKQGDGTVGHLTNGLVDRTGYYVQAGIMALIPMMQEDLYCP
uniref:inosine/xanthosine triphosphatase n=1 Tax=Hemiselmis andersenii TaxID=464988 RepID=A0A7S0U0M5_HEMAN|mmetsp:Transcript_33355/g.77802  ORF Transcript_33355/g.77802 Transcript_33355/m.77802 type:complete len:190 (+) Transcript_33355:216-785(+)